jgi:signal transduction histidine kinase
VGPERVSDGPVRAREDRPERLPWNSVSLRYRLAALSSLVTLLALAALALGSGLALERSRLRDLDDELRVVAKTLIDDALESKTNTPSTTADDTLQSVNGNASAFIFRDTPPHLLIWSSGPDAPDPLDASFLGSSARIEVCSCDGWRVRSERRGGLIVQAGRPLAPIERTIESYARISTFGTLIAALLAGLVTVLAVNTATVDLDRLTRRVHDLESHDPIPGAARGDEIGTLARAIRRSRELTLEQREREARFLADASHELRTPITALVAELEHALARKRSSDEQRLALERSLRVATHMHDLASNLLTLQRTRVGERLARAPLELLEIASDAVDRMMPLAAAKGVSLEVNGTKTRIAGDRVLLTRMIENLIGNAIKYTQTGETALEVHPESDAAVLTVRDTGVGIPADKIAQLFEPFNRADPAHRDGYGLGLAVVRGVAEAHGGTATVSSVVGEGTTVTVRLPLETW